MSVEELQSNFNALQVSNCICWSSKSWLPAHPVSLQQRFMAVMSEKAELQDRVQEEEHRILQLSGETETIGEYIALYQIQREALREKFIEKDHFIQQLIADKTAMQVSCSLPIN